MTTVSFHRVLRPRKTFLFTYSAATYYRLNQSTPSCPPRSPSSHVQQWRKSLIPGYCFITYPSSNSLWLRILTLIYFLSSIYQPVSTTEMDVFFALHSISGAIFSNSFFISCRSCSTLVLSHPHRRWMKVNEVSWLKWRSKSCLCKNILEVVLTALWAVWYETGNCGWNGVTSRKRVKSTFYICVFVPLSHFKRRGVQRRHSEVADKLFKCQQQRRLLPLYNWMCVWGKESASCTMEVPPAV